MSSLNYIAIDKESQESVERAWKALITNPKLSGNNTNSAYVPYLFNDGDPQSDPLFVINGLKKRFSCCYYGGHFTITKGYFADYVKAYALNKVISQEEAVVGLHEVRTLLMALDMMVTEVSVNNKSFLSRMLDVENKLREVGEAADAFDEVMRSCFDEHDDRTLVFQNRMIGFTDYLESMNVDLTGFGKDDVLFRCRVDEDMYSSILLIVDDKTRLLLISVDHSVVMHSNNDQFYNNIRRLDITSTTILELINEDVDDCIELLKRIATEPRKACQGKCNKPAVISPSVE